MSQPHTTTPSLFLREEELRRGLGLVFAANRDITADADPLLERHGIGRAHMRALLLIAQYPGTPVGGVLALLRITKQSLSRVLADLTDKGLIRIEAGRDDRRQRLLWLTDAGARLEREIFASMRERIARAYRTAGPDAVAGFWQVLDAMAGE